MRCHDGATRSPTIPVPAGADPGKVETVLGTEIRHALLVALNNVSAGYDRDFFDAVKQEDSAGACQSRSEAIRRAGNCSNG